LLLSGDATVNTKPQLEIYADDVKCSHGSSIGQLDPDALFYLRSRGLGPDEARSLLSFAFASDIVGRIKVDPLRQRLDDYLAAKFRDH
jgi:Fe-S cluster assembly protein SufD